jgi:hypothetical protein
MFEYAPWVFVIDTNSYSGNFETDLFLFCTEQDEDMSGGNDLVDNLMRVSLCTDDYPTQESYSIWTTPGYFNNGFGMEYREDNEEEKTKAMNHAIEQFENMKTDNVHPDYRDAHISHCQTFIDAIRNGSSPLFFAAQSVGIFFSVKPLPEQITLLKERALKFVESWKQNGNENKPLVITGFRLLHFNLVEEKEWEEKR